MGEKKYINNSSLSKDKKSLELVRNNTISKQTPAYWESTLFSEVYLKYDLSKDFDENGIKVSMI